MKSCPKTQKEPSAERWKNTNGNITAGHKAGVVDSQYESWSDAMSNA